MTLQEGHMDTAGERMILWGKHRIWRERICPRIRQERDGQKL